MEKQITSNLMMVRPKNFSSNQETQASNEFQSKIGESSGLSEIRSLVDSEFQNMTKLFLEHDINHFIFDDLRNLGSPDAIFPNNWVTFHEDGTVIFYPMMSIKRRNERRPDIINSLSDQGFLIRNIMDLSFLENDAEFLEGTGSMILDRQNKKAYACISSRTSTKALDIFSEMMGYEVISFNTSSKIPVYHTNVMMSLGEDTALVCFDIIEEQELSEKIKLSLIDSGRAVINISIEQMNHFLGNVLEIQNNKGEKLLLMSKTAHDSLMPQQLAKLSQRLSVLSFSIPTIEKYGGGSVRCMLAEIFLEKEYR